MPKGWTVNASFGSTPRATGSELPSGHPDLIRLVDTAQKKGARPGTNDQGPARSWRALFLADADANFPSWTPLVRRHGARPPVLARIMAVTDWQLTAAAARDLPNAK